MNYGCFKPEGENFGGNKVAKRELARKALFKIMMAVVDFILALRIFVVAMFFGKRVFEVANPVKRRIQNRKQENTCQQHLDYGNF